MDVLAMVITIVVGAGVGFPLIFVLIDGCWHFYREMFFRIRRWWWEGR